MRLLRQPGGFEGFLPGAGDHAEEPSVAKREHAAHPIIDLHAAGTTAGADSMERHDLAPGDRWRGSGPGRRTTRR